MSCGEFQARACQCGSETLNPHEAMIAASGPPALSDGLECDTRYSAVGDTITLFDTTNAVALEFTRM